MSLWHQLMRPHAFKPEPLGQGIESWDSGFMGGRSFSDPNSTSNHNLLVYDANSEEQQGGEMYSAATVGVSTDAEGCCRGDR